MVDNLGSNISDLLKTLHQAKKTSILKLRIINYKYYLALVLLVLSWKMCLL